MLTIGKLAEHAHVSTDSIRFYERQGLLVPSTRSPAGYRLYDHRAAQRLAFITQARRCGFSVPQIRELLEAGTGAQRLAAEKKKEIDKTIAALRSMSAALSSYVAGEPLVAEH